MNETSDLEIRIQVNPDEMSWPGESRTAHDRSVNHCYEDLSGVTWSDVDDVLAEESPLVDAIGTASNEERGSVVSVADDDWYETGIGLELGVASATYALNAAGCPTITSCGGNSCGYPYVAFWARRADLEVLSDVARRAGVGLGNTLDGALEIYAMPDAYGAMIIFAMLLRDARRSS